ncbi:related to Dik6, novel virulence factor [Ustilago trichophora]|uniref:Related to Dik6, novel virulence factor n=1 Tax=Ustilago trichophora TaxID=86804 RepID=A0A5C3E010_9BASI|nr:related to Dik6, novel virulence factor [Ustilago trichophora]
MRMGAIPDLDAPGRPLSLTQAIDPNSLKFLHRGQTNAQIIQSLFTVIYAPWPKSNRAWLLASECEVALTFVVCALMLYNKRRMGKLWILTKRDSIHGTFYVTNSVFVLVLGVTTYLFSWSVTAMVVIASSYKGLSSMEWWWCLPAPWLPLVITAYISLHGFILGCSPRSPLSSSLAQNMSKRNRWFYLPLPKSSMVWNMTLFLPCLLLLISTVIITAFSGRSFYQAKALAQQLLSPVIHQQMNRLAHEARMDFPEANLPVSDDLIWTARTVAAAYFDCHRYVSMNSCIFAACAFGIWIPCLLYGLPNAVSLVEHACFRHPDQLPSYCSSFLGKLWFLLTKGKPKTEYSTTHLSISTWKMAILAVVYVEVLVISIPAFGWLPILLYRNAFPTGILAGDITETMRISILAVSIITISSCTCVAIFCTVATLDPLFRAAIGLNMIRTQIAIDIQVVHRKSRREEFDPDPEPMLPEIAIKEEGLLTLHELHMGNGPRLSRQPSATTFNSFKSASPSTGDQKGAAEQNIHLAL